MLALAGTHMGSKGSILKIIFFTLLLSENVNMQREILEPNSKKEFEPSRTVLEIALFL